MKIYDFVLSTCLGMNILLDLKITHALNFDFFYHVDIFIIIYVLCFERNQTQDLLLRWLTFKPFITPVAIKSN